MFSQLHTLPHIHRAGSLYSIVNQFPTVNLFNAIKKKKNTLFAVNEPVFVITAVISMQRQRKQDIRDLL